ncbi:hypothetical protein EYF80_026277 [Liparis tanakae]|uniref:Uncharacterized protein n=1 Tax=Liparis tanakae TaxID=230148 RepID=A0A4Z2HE36_9TELE|nr:hypothetical protein EYF80_026277 [Liparis tanakae]
MQEAAAIGPAGGEASSDKITSAAATGAAAARKRTPFCVKLLISLRDVFLSRKTSLNVGMDHDPDLHDSDLHDPDLHDPDLQDPDLQDPSGR